MMFVIVMYVQVNVLLDQYLGTLLVVIGHWIVAPA